MNIWQIAAGDEARDYTKLFIEHDIMLIGPGRYGPYKENRDLYSTVKKATREQISNFITQPKPGDFVLLRKGQRVEAIGRIPATPEDKYLWDTRFDDVLGWDLEHCRRVQWEVTLVSKLSSIQTAITPLFKSSQQRTFSKVHLPAIHNLLKGLTFITRDLKPLPIESNSITMEELGEELFSAGLANDAVDDVINSLSRSRRLNKWYASQHDSKRPTEHEIVAHMIVPLMLGLGWSEQLMPIEWKKVDIAFFSRTPTMNDHCVMICEAKGVGGSLSAAYNQAINYINMLGLNHCKKVITTDGSCIFLYKKPDTGWLIDDDPSGYINLRTIRKQNIFPFNTSGVQTLIELIPWIAMR